MAESGRIIFFGQIRPDSAGKSFILLIEAKKAVYPRDVRQDLWQFKDSNHTRPKGKAKEPLSILVAESISPGAKELLRNERVGYYDSGGSLYLPAPGAYLYIDRPQPNTLAKAVRSLYSGRSAQVVHALLVQHQDWFSVKERYLREPAALLDGWVKQLASIRSLNLRRYYVPTIKADAMLQRVGEVFDAHDAGYAVSHEAAAQRYAPFLTSVSQVRIRMLIGENADGAITDLGARVVNEGANLVIIEA